MPDNHLCPPPRPSADSSNFAMRVKICRLDDPSDQRRFSVSASEPVMIGRASRSPEKQPQPASDNARFHSMVVSRSHAKLQAHPWNPYNDQVTVTDLRSTHGTWVNGKKIEPGRPMVLRSGDTVRFGEDVIGGSPNHNHRAPTVVYHRVFDENEPQEPVVPRVQNSRFAVPSDIDSSSQGELSDFLSSDEEEGEVMVSSPNTTPEKLKAKIGSQESPIDLDRSGTFDRVVPTINLDEDESMSLPEQLSTHLAGNHVSKVGVVVIPEDPKDSQSQSEAIVIVEDSIIEIPQRPIVATKAGTAAPGTHEYFDITDENNYSAIAVPARAKDAATDQNDTTNKVEQDLEIDTESEDEFEDDVDDFGLGNYNKETAHVPLQTFSSQEPGFTSPSARPRYDPVRESPVVENRVDICKPNSTNGNIPWHPYMDSQPYTTTDKHELWPSMGYIYPVPTTAGPVFMNNSSDNQHWGTSMQMQAPYQDSHVPLTGWIDGQTSIYQPIAHSWEPEHKNTVNDSYVNVRETVSISFPPATTDQTGTKKPSTGTVKRDSAAAIPGLNATRDKIPISSIVNEQTSAQTIGGAANRSAQSKSGTKRSADDLTDTTLATEVPGASSSGDNVAERPSKRQKMQDRPAKSKLGRFVNNAAYAVLGAVSVYAFLETPLAERLLESLGA